MTNQEPFFKIKAKKSLGQNFLKDQTVLDTIIEAAEITEEDNIVEIGPGKGALTKEILKQTSRLTAVEMDDRLLPILESLFKKYPEAKLVHGNALEFKPDLKPYKLVANIPYYITSPILTHFLLEESERGNLPLKIILLVQKEVAQKICNPKKNSVLSLSVKIFGTPTYVQTVKAEAFDPAPKVDSAIISISDIHGIETNSARSVIKLIKHCFHNPRKTLRNNLKMLFQGDEVQADQLLELSQIPGTHRPEKLTVQQWFTLDTTYNKLRQES